MATKVMTHEQICAEFYRQCAVPLECRACEHYRQQYELSQCHGRALQRAALQFADQLNALAGANKTLNTELRETQSKNMRLHCESYDMISYINRLQRDIMLLQLELEKVRNQQKQNE